MFRFVLASRESQSGEFRWRILFVPDQGAMRLLFEHDFTGGTSRTRQSGLLPGLSAGSVHHLSVVFAAGTAESYVAVYWDGDVFDAAPMGVVDADYCESAANCTVDVLLLAPGVSAPVGHVWDFRWYRYALPDRIIREMAGVDVILPAVARDCLCPESHPVQQQTSDSLCTDHFESSVRYVESVL